MCNPKLLQIKYAEAFFSSSFKAFKLFTFTFVSQMKKLIILLIAVIYMGAASGTTVHLHYCMEKLIGYDLIKSEGEKCNKCGMEAGKDCCKDEQKLLKLDTEHKASESNFYFVKLLPAIVQHTSEVAAERLTATVALHPLAHAPPFIYSNPIYLRNCVFLI